MKKIVVSGIQPTGNLHLGNYLGAIKQWKELQDNPEYECKFGIMDLHAMTTDKGLEFIDDKKSDLSIFFNSLRHVGIKHKNIFFQSEYKEEIMSMYWTLACNASIGQLNRMTQFKEKSDKNNQNLGLFSYPVLMAADILALEADLVPVGEDQKQHLELARDNDFGFFGDKISIFDEVNENYLWFDKDEKDPLNRFNGLFDGRTYGEGRFVLIEDNEDDVTECDLSYQKYYLKGNKLDDDDKEYEIRKIIGNLHENPELWNKI